MEHKFIRDRVSKAVLNTDVNPLEPYKMCELYDTTTEYNKGEWEFPIREGHLLLWPSWFQHETKVNTTNERYVISFNTIIKGNYAQHE